MKKRKEVLNTLLFYKENLQSDFTQKGDLQYARNNLTKETTPNFKHPLNVHVIQDVLGVSFKVVDQVKYKDGNVDIRKDKRYAYYSEVDSGEQFKLRKRMNKLTDTIMEKHNALILPLVLEVSKGMNEQMLYNIRSYTQYKDELENLTTKLQQLKDSKGGDKTYISEIEQQQNTLEDSYSLALEKAHTRITKTKERLLKIKKQRQEIEENIKKAEAEEMQLLQQISSNLDG